MDRDLWRATQFGNLFHIENRTSANFVPIIHCDSTISFTEDRSHSTPGSSGRPAQQFIQLLAIYYKIQNISVKTENLLTI